MADAGNYSLQPWGGEYTVVEDPLNAAVAKLGSTDPGVPFVKTMKVCSILALMPPVYALAESDPLTKVLSVIGNSDNDIGGVTCVPC